MYAERSPPKESNLTAPGFPISLLLIGMIYTSTWALKFLSIPVYTIFKNLTIILIAYGEVLWFGGSVTHMALFSFGLMVMSSIIAAWADIQHALSSYGQIQDAAASAAMSTLHSGYLWMMFNCLCTAAYVLGMRKRIKLTNFKDFDSEYRKDHRRSRLTSNSHVLQQLAHHSHPACCVHPR
jgi:GDP-mannose transporter